MTRRGPGRRDGPDGDDEREARVHRRAGEPRRVHGRALAPHLKSALQCLKVLVDYFHHEIRERAAIALQQLGPWGLPRARGPARDPAYAAPPNDEKEPKAINWTKGSDEPVPPAQLAVYVQDCVGLLLRLIAEDTAKSVAAVACESLNELIQDAGPSSFMSRLPQLLEALILLANGKAPCQTLLGDDDDHDDEDDDDHDNVLMDNVADLCGGVAKVAGARLGTEATDAMFRAFARYAQPSRSASDRAMALGCFAELCVEFRRSWPPIDILGRYNRCSRRRVATSMRTSRGMRPSASVRCVKEHLQTRSPISRARCTRCSRSCKGRTLPKRNARPRTPRRPTTRWRRCSAFVLRTSSLPRSTRSSGSCYRDYLCRRTPGKIPRVLSSSSTWPSRATRRFRRTRPPSGRPCQRCCPRTSSTTRPSRSRRKGAARAAGGKVLELINLAACERTIHHFRRPGRGAFQTRQGRQYSQVSEEESRPHAGDMAASSSERKTSITPLVSDTAL